MGEDERRLKKGKKEGTGERGSCVLIRRGKHLPKEEGGAPTRHGGVSRIKIEKKTCLKKRRKRAEAKPGTNSFGGGEDWGVRRRRSRGGNKVVTTFTKGGVSRFGRDGKESIGGGEHKEKKKGLGEKNEIYKRPFEKKTWGKGSSVPRSHGKK